MFGLARVSSKVTAKFTHKLFTILPFETKWFKERRSANCTVYAPVFSEYLATSKAMDLIPLEQRQEILFYQEVGIVRFEL